MIAKKKNALPNGNRAFPIIVLLFCFLVNAKSALRNLWREITERINGTKVWKFIFDMSQLKEANRCHRNATRHLKQHCRKHTSNKKAETQRCFGSRVCSKHHQLLSYLHKNYQEEGGKCNMRFIFGDDLIIRRVRRTNVVRVVQYVGRSYVRQPLQRRTPPPPSLISPCRDGAKVTFGKKASTPLKIASENQCFACI